ncbi:MAG: hypothetical protein AAB426_07035, partial [Myxococcota bacterium]
GERTTMIVPMQLLALGCGAVALSLPLLTSWLRRVAQVFAGGRELPPLPMETSRVTVVLAALAGVVVVALVAFARLHLRAPAPQSGTWDCGYARPTSRMQTTSTSLSELAIGLLWRVLLPVRSLPRLVGVLPGPSVFDESVPDPVLDRGALPLFRLIGRIVPWLRLTQQGNLQAYILYILVAIVALMMVH